jgi:cholesterol transport system auxiliary component
MTDPRHPLSVRLPSPGFGLGGFCSPARAGLAAMAFGAALLAGCGGLSSLPDKPVRPEFYDFGPHAPQAQAAPTGVPIALARFDVPAALDSTRMLYRLAYADAQMPKPYAHARWSMAPAQLMYQRLRAVLGERHPIVLVGEGYARIELRVELEEFSQIFTSPGESHGLVRIRATALAPNNRGDRLLGQRGFEVSAPAPTPDAVGGVKAMTQASDQITRELAQWVEGLVPEQDRR